VKWRPGSGQGSRDRGYLWVTQPQAPFGADPCAEFTLSETNGLRAGSPDEVGTGSGRRYACSITKRKAS